MTITAALIEQLTLHKSRHPDQALPQPLFNKLVNYSFVLIIQQNIAELDEILANMNPQDEYNLWIMINVLRLSIDNEQFQATQLTKKVTPNLKGLKS